VAQAFTSLLAGGASMPYAAYQFQQIQPYWIPANLIAVPLTALWIMPWGLAALALMPLHLAVLALAPMGWGIAVIVWITARIATWPAAMLRIAPIPDAAILLVTAGLIWLCIWRSAARYAGAWADTCVADRGAPGRARHPFAPRGPGNLARMCRACRRGRSQPLFLSYPQTPNPQKPQKHGVCVNA
jgi:hypothetical protein